MKLIGNLPAGLGSSESNHLNFSRDVLLATIYQSRDVDNESNTPMGAITELSCRDVIHLAESIVKTTDTGSEERKRQILSSFLNKFEMQNAEVDLLGKVLLVINSHQGEIRIGLSLDTFEKMIIEEMEKGRIKEKDIGTFERFLFNRFIKTPGRKYSSHSPPIQVMLARPLLEVSQIPSALKNYSTLVIVEKKYDGERVLVPIILPAPLG